MQRRSWFAAISAQGLSIRGMRESLLRTLVTALPFFRGPRVRKFIRLSLVPLPCALPGEDVYAPGLKVIVYPLGSGFLPDSAPLEAPVGSPVSEISQDVSSAGFTTTAHSATSAGAISRKERGMGKFREAFGRRGHGAFLTLLHPSARKGTREQKTGGKKYGGVP